MSLGFYVGNGILIIGCIVALWVVVAMLVDLWRGRL